MQSVAIVGTGLIGASFGLALRQAGFGDALVVPISSEETKRPARRPRNSQLENARLKREGIALLPDWQDAVGRYLSRLSTGSS